MTGDGEEIVCEWPTNQREDGESVASASSFRRYGPSERQQRFEALHDTTRELMHVESREAAAELVVETARDLLGSPLSAVFLADESADALWPTAVTTGSGDYRRHPTFSESILWLGGGRLRRRVFSTMSPLSPPRQTDTRLERLLIPLGDHGVLLAASTDAAAFEDASVSLVRTARSNFGKPSDRPAA
ncbi:hypothetical protein C8039_17480 [Halogeometricum sp. wsp3]|nr:hypothetical protein C8039_17480 [Halogeometricum sp. wsp3]